MDSIESLGAKMKKSLVPRWFKKRYQTATISECDPSCKVVYLGNVLTGWAKGTTFAQFLALPLLPFLLFPFAF